MGFCSQFKALLRKHFIVWRRNLCSSICEIIFPVIMMLLLTNLRLLLKEKTMEPISYVENCKYGYYFDANTKINLDPNVQNTADWMGLCKADPFTSCAGYNMPLFGIVVDDSSIYSQLEDSLVGANGGQPMTFSARKFDSESELEEYVRSGDYGSSSSPGLCAGIVISGSGNSYDVKLRYDDNYLVSGEHKKQQVPTTKKPITDPFVKVPQEEEYEMYQTSGFTYLQYLIVKTLGGSSINNLKVGVIPMKVPEYIEDEFFTGPGFLAGLIIVLCYLPPIFKLVSMIVLDKELNTREGMKIMGLRDAAYWASLLVYYFVILLVIAVLLACIATFVIFTHSNWFVLFLFFLLYGIAICFFGFFIATLFHRARIASIAAALVYLCLYSISNFIMNDAVNTNIGEGSKCATILLPTVAATLGSNLLIKIEGGQEGLTFSTLNDTIGNFRFFLIYIMLAVDIIIYGILGLYLDNVMPSANGTRKPLHFFLTREYWSTGKSSSASNTNYEDDSKLLYPDSHFEVIGNEFKAQEEANDCMKIRHLNKSFGSKHSVSDLSFNLYKGQIFALLGPNGAGKTTTISMLSGLLPPTSGGATFSGIEVFREMSKMRTMLGVCPQHDVLFDLLTPKEHLEIFAAFKGRSSMEQEVNEILEDIELKDCLDVRAEKLSGGQRRKLSIGMAFIGNSDVIFLDEPTSGIDINTRKNVWAMLRKYKQDKIIIMTTHYMEEAEELGDRIGIMTHGALKCVGTPLFLKTVYGAGYNLTIIYDDVPQPQQNAVQENITKHLKSHVKEVSIKKMTEKEITYFLPKNQAKDLKELFVELDKNLKSLKIKSYGIATNSLEEIFLQVASEDETVEVKKQKVAIDIPLEDQTEEGKDSDLDSYSIANEKNSSCCSDFALHFLAISMKRLYISYRNWGGFIIEILMPILLVILSLLLTKIKLFYDSDPRWFNADSYGSQSFLINSADSLTTSTNSFAQYLDSDFDVSTHDITFANGADENALKSMEKLIYDSDNHGPYGSLLVNKQDTASKDFEYILFANLASQDSAGAYMGYLGQTILRLATNDQDFKLTFANSPLPITSETKGREQAKNGDIVSSTLVIAFALIPSYIISYIVQERESNLKHQQVITGVSLLAYWVANCVIDTLKSLISCSISIGLIYAFNVDLSYTWLLMLLYCLCIVPFTYFTSFMFTKENSAQTVTLLFHFFIGMVGSIIVNVLFGFDSTRSAAKIIAWILRVVPSFNLGDGINYICYKVIIALAEDKPIPDNDLSLDVAGQHIIYFSVVFAASIILIAIFESRIFSCFLACCEPFKIKDSALAMDKHELVVKEEKYCDTLSLEDNPPAVVGRHLNKVYKIDSKKLTVAVDDVSFGVNIGECLALLGTSGAGKTTTFKMLTRDVLPSRGEVFINGMDLQHNFSQIRRLIGYGPQYESGFMSMTVRENLEFYAMLKGIPSSIRGRMITRLISDMNLEEFENVLVGNLSGGNKRKTTVAIALLGNPPIVLLDEPSTGVDPQAKRFMWQVIQRVSTTNKNTAVVLTTHSMEEAENLCTKMAIMASGNFCCIGSPQELKQTFGKGYEIQISIPSPSTNDENAFLEKTSLASVTELGRDEVVKLFNEVEMPELEAQLDAKGTAAHIMTEINVKGKVQARLVANYLIVQKLGVEIAQTLANEFGEVKIAEHIGNFFKFRADKMNENQTIGYLFGLLQDIVNKYSITQYSASQTSLNQIFQTLARNAEFGLSVAQDSMVVRSGTNNANNIKGKKKSLNMI